MAITKLSITGNTTSVGISTTPVEIMLVKTKATGVPVTPNDNITTTNVQAALEQLDDIKVQATNGTLANPTITGSASFGDNAKANFGAGNDLQIYHQSSNGNSIIKESGGGILSLQTNGSEIGFYDTANNQHIAWFKTGAECSLRYNGSERFKTTSTGIDITGSQTTSGNAGIGTSTIVDSKLHLRTTSSCNLRIEGGDPNSKNIVFVKNTGGTQQAKITAVGENLYFTTGTTQERMRIDSSGNVGIGTTNPTGKLHVSNGSSGATVNSNADDLIIESATNAGISILGDGNETQYLMFGDAANSTVGRVLYDHNTNHMALWTNANERLRIDNNGDISFYEDTGTTPKFFWDASAESLGIGTTSPSRKLDVVGQIKADDAIEIQGNGYARLEVGGGTGAYIDLKTPDSDDYDVRLITDGSGGILNVASGEFVIQQGGSQKLATTSTGIDVTGGMTTTGNVGIGNTGTPQRLTVGEGTATIGLQPDATNGSYIRVGGTGSGSNVLRILGHSDVEKARFDESGNLLVGTTTNPSGTVEGIRAASNGVLYAASAGTAPLVLYRHDSDGNILNFHRDGTSVGSIGTASGTLVVGTTNGSGSYLKFGSNVVAPVDVNGAVRDNAIDLGQTNARFKDLYLSGGVHLGGTGSANKLDDYEEGTFTPSFNYGTGITYTTQVGTYTKIGSLVTATFDIIVSALGSDTDEVHITLPFASTGDFCVFTVSAYASNLVHGGSPGSPTSGHTANVARLSGSHIVLSENDGERLQFSDLQSAGRLSGAVTYRTTA